jgi:hypothetical protein
VLARPVPIERTYQHAHVEMVREIKRAKKRAQDAQAERARMQEEEQRAAAGRTEIKRQRYHSAREQRRVMREEARAIMQREAAGIAWAPLRRFQPRSTRHEP